MVAELLRRGWTDAEVKAALGNNLLRVLKKTEEVRKTHNIEPCVCVSDITSSTTQKAPGNSCIMSSVALRRSAELS